MKFLKYITLFIAIIFLTVGVCLLPIWDQDVIIDSDLINSVIAIPENANLQSTFYSISK